MSRYSSLAFAPVLPISAIQAHLHALLAMVLAMSLAIILMECLVGIFELFLADFIDQQNIFPIRK